MRQWLRRMERRGPWELGLAISLGAALFGMLVTVVWDRGELQLESIRVPAGMLFAALTLLLLVAWLAQDLTKRAQIAQFQAIAEMQQRHLRTEQALRDRLTGVYNRAALLESAAHYMNRAERGGEPLALVVMDLDRFHELNNKFGHIAGDLALASFAHVLQGSIRGSDVAARYGGDEFVLLLAETAPEGAEVVIRRVEEQLGAYNDQAAEGHIPLSFSAGTGIFQKGMDFEGLFRVADLDLLRRKAERRGTAVPAARD